MLSQLIRDKTKCNFHSNALGFSHSCEPYSTPTTTQVTQNLHRNAPDPTRLQSIVISSLHCSIPQKHGPRMKCSACKIVVHTSCLPIVMQRAPMACKPTFRDVGVRQYREQTTTHHQWVHRRTEKGKCQQCGKVSEWGCSAAARFNFC